MFGNFSWTRKFLIQGNPTSIGLISLSTYVSRILSFLIWLEEKIFRRNLSNHVWQVGRNVILTFLKGRIEIKIQDNEGVADPTSIRSKGNKVVKMPSPARQQHVFPFLFFFFPHLLDEKGKKNHFSSKNPHPNMLTKMQLN